MTNKLPRTSWEGVSRWYNDKVGEEGHYYHQQVILPQLSKMLSLSKEKGSCLVDLACGQGILSRHIAPSIPYLGIDASKQLIQSAQQMNKSPLHHFMVGDITQSIQTKWAPFTHATVILALQNIESPQKVIQNAYQLLQKKGELCIVLNHPCFRIPRQSSWKIDEQQKIQFRRIDRYMSSMEIPIQMEPGKGSHSSQTFSFHHPLSSYTHWLKESGFLIQSIEEWCSNKISQGKAAKMENRSREEIPLFMAISAVKID